MKNLLHFVFIGILSFNSFSLLAQDADNPENKPMVSVEQMPQYPGGEEALIKFIKDNLKYPAASFQKGIEGRVTIRFVVGAEGAVSDVIVIRGLDSLCDQEAVRVVKLMPIWTPGQVNGKKVPVYYTLPVVYRLQKNTSLMVTPHLIVDGNSQPFSMLQDTLRLKPTDIKSIKMLKESDATAIYGALGKNGVIVVETKTAAAKRDSAISQDKPVYSVEMMPQFPGGENALLAFIGNNLHYPIADAQRGTQGRTVIQFVVNKLGKVCDITVIRGLSPTCDAEAVRVVNMMPTWEPGYQKGVPVSVYYTLPIMFKLQR